MSSDLFQPYTAAKPSEAVKKAEAPKEATSADGKKTEPANKVDAPKEPAAAQKIEPVKTSAVLDPEKASSYMRMLHPDSDDQVHAVKNLVDNPFDKKKPALEPATEDDKEKMKDKEKKLLESAEARKKALDASKEEQDKKDKEVAAKVQEKKDATEKLVPNFKLLALQEHGLAWSKLKVCRCRRRKVIVIAHPNYVWRANNQFLQ